MEVIREGDVCTLRPEGYDAEGRAVARLENGAVIFVRGALRGELCRVEIEKVGRSAVWGRLVEPLERSAHRAESDCPYYGRCGGCAMRHMTYREELYAKRLRVEEALRRIGGADVRVETIHAASECLRYRNKVQFPVQAGAKGVSIGFYQKGSHRVVDVEDCLLQGEGAARLRRATLEWMEKWKIPPYEERRGGGLVRHLYVRVDRAGRSLCCLLINGEKVPHEEELVRALRQAEKGLTGVVLGINRARTNVILGSAYRTLWGRDYLEDTLCGLTFRLSVPSFYQVNPAQTEVLYGRALELAGLTGEELALDLYCGIGTIGLAAARRCRRVLGAEVVPQAVEDARANAARNGIANAEFFCADAGEMAERLLQEGTRPDVIFVDPPRKGLSPQVVEACAAMAPRRLIYVSCDPGTLGRDVKRFGELGYTLRQAEAVDLFPRTAHVETVAALYP